MQSSERLKVQILKTYASTLKSGTDARLHCKYRYGMYGEPASCWGLEPYARVLEP